MPRATENLTKRRVSKFSAADGKDAFLWDAQVRGFGVRVSGRTGDKFYVRSATGASSLAT